MNKKLTINRDSSKHYAYLVMTIIAGLILTFLFAGCVSVSKATRVLDRNASSAIKYAVKVFDNADSIRDGLPKFGTNDSLAATYSHLRYPCVDRKDSAIRYLPGKKILVSGEKEYVTIDCDSLFKATGKRGRIEVPVPVYMRVDTQSILATHWQTDKALYNSMVAQKDGIINIHRHNYLMAKKSAKEAGDLAKKYQHVAVTYRKRCVWLLIVIGVMVCGFILGKKFNLI